MFTRYNGIEIPQNYSGSRFKNEAPPTETKTHKPSLAIGTKTSISPSFESALRRQTSNETKYDDEIIDEFIEANEPELDSGEDNSFFEEPEQNIEIPEKTLFNEFKPIVSQIIKSVDQEDLLLLSLVFLLMSEGNESSGELIIPLLLLFLYR